MLNLLASLACAFTLTLCLSSCWSQKINCVDKPKSTCVCHFSNGSVIDLTTVGWKDKPRFQDVVGKDGYSYSYNPCYGFSEGPKPAVGADGCDTGTAVCQGKIDKSAYYNAGLQSSATFYQNGPFVVIEYTSNLPPFRTTNVTLVCSTNTSSTALGEAEKDKTHYEMTLYSPCACLNGCVIPPVPKERGLSTGSVLVIIFFISVCCYLIGGIIYQKIIRGATGFELIPNFEFWLEFPLLVRDGCIFCCNGCNMNQETTYDRI